MTRVIILSLTAALDQMTEEKLTEDDLKEAIFCLGCTRPFALEWDAERILNYQRRHQTQKVEVGHVMKFTKYLEEAERDGRVVWRRENDGSDVPTKSIHLDLNRVLEQHGLRPLDPDAPLVNLNSFFKVALARANNRENLTRVRVIG